MQSGIQIDTLLKDPPSETNGFYFQQTMYRIKDPRKTIPFYNEVLGMRLLKQCDFPEMKFSLFFMGYKQPEELPPAGSTDDERMRFALSTPSTVELT